MKVYNENQFNQEVEQYKLISSTNGVGSLIATRMGTFIMPMEIGHWMFIKRANEFIKRSLEAGREISNYDIEQQAVSVIEDDRFVRYLRKYEGIPQLKALVAIPQSQLTSKGYIDVKHNPIFKKYYSGDDPRNHTDDFVVPAIVFPRWLYSANPTSNKLRSLGEWRKLWEAEKGRNKFYEFAPPRDAETKYERSKRGGEKVTEYGLLKQMPLVLICEKGHISDIPWDRFFCASIEEPRELVKPGYPLFEKTFAGSCRHELTYTESQNKSSGWGMLKCNKCGAVVSLDGIMNIRPQCPGEKPWAGEGSQNDNCKEQMRVALLTSSGAYFADQVSSLYVKPMIGGQSLTPGQDKILNYITEAYRKANETSPIDKDAFWNQRKDAVSSMLTLGMIPGFDAVTYNDISLAVSSFLDNSAAETQDYKGQYRFEEYEVFSKNREMDLPKLKFKDIALPDELKPYFNKISQVETLCVTTTQMNFFRSELPTVERSQVTGKINYPEGMKLFGSNADKVFVYPAYQSFGEGLFFEFNIDKLKEFTSIKEQFDPERYKRRDRRLCSQLSAQLDMYGNAEKFYLIHTFAHALIKELEFACGYPSASIAERVYYSDKMHGVLIYTTGSSEGSMGGLVWQGNPNRIKSIIISAIRRATQCSSDPICWMHTEETMNYASCFSCTMISETSCEYRNYGLDRRALVDDDFGFFKELL